MKDGDKLMKDGDLVYRTSYKQGLSEFKPRKVNSYHNESVRGDKVIYLTSSRAYCSAFSFNWRDEDVELSSYDNNETFEINIPKRIEYLIDEERKISLYSFEFDWMLMKPVREVSTPEFISKKRISVYKEDIYSSARECMLSNNLKINII